MSTTLTQLRNRTRIFLDDTTTNNWSSDDLDIYINEAESSLWQKLCEYDSSFGLRESTATLVESQVDYTYPEDILGRNVWSLFSYLTSTGIWYRVTRKNYDQVIDEGMTARDYPRAYCCMDGFFKIGPPPTSAGYSLRLAYTRQPTAMSADASPMDSDDEYKELIACDAALRALERKGGDTKTFELLTTRKAELLADAVRSITPNDLQQTYPSWRY